MRGCTLDLRSLVNYRIDLIWKKMGCAIADFQAGE